MKVLVVCYSRTGNTRKVAQAIADALRPQGEVTLEEIVDRKNRKGFLGWLGAGKDATLKKATPIEPLKAEVTGHDLVIVGTPVWAFTAASPVRTFLQERGGDIARPAFFCTMGGSGAPGAFAAMEELCGKAPAATLALNEKEFKDAEVLRDKVRDFVAALVKPAGNA